MEILGIDIGGSGIKAAIVNIERGEIVSERFRLPTPKPSKPDQPEALNKPEMTKEEEAGSGPPTTARPSE